MTDIVPFGKYKDRPVDVLLDDRAYAQWLVEQAWFRQRYREMFDLVVHGSDVDQASPEHNQMQAQFLESEWLMRVAQKLLEFERLENHVFLRQRERLCSFELEGSPVIVKTQGPRFEVGGWDVIGSVTFEFSGRVETLTYSYAFSDEPDYKEGERKVYSICQRGQIYFSIELKPTLSDDYPTVLREMKRRKEELEGLSYKNKVLIVRRAEFEHLTWDQVVRIFAAEGFTALLESEVQP